MLGKRPKPLIGKLSELLVSTHRAGAGTFNIPTSTTTSPKTPLDYRIHSPRSGMKSFDIGGVGLGIVAALEKSSNGYAICSSKLKSNPIPVVSGHRQPEDQEMEIESLDENYTYVTCHGPNNKSFTKVYYDGGNISDTNKIRTTTTTTTHEPNHRGPVFVVDNKRSSSSSSSSSSCDDYHYPTSDFLSSCNLCSKKLHGKDIYMYRGEKAFCSTECRSRQIMIDERKERCRSEASSSSSSDILSSSPYNNQNNIFSTGILAI